VTPVNFPGFNIGVLASKAVGAILWAQVGAPKTNDQLILLVEALDGRVLLVEGH